jgi:hypothetical protein
MQYQFAERTLAPDNLLLEAAPAHYRAPQRSRDHIAGEGSLPSGIVPICACALADLLVGTHCPGLHLVMHSGTRLANSSLVSSGRHKQAADRHLAGITSPGSAAPLQDYGA